MYHVRVRKDILTLPLKTGTAGEGDIVHPRGRRFRGPLVKGHKAVLDCVYTEKGISKKEKGISKKDLEYDNPTDA